MHFFVNKVLGFIRNLVIELKAIVFHTIIPKIFLSRFLKSQQTPIQVKINKKTRLQITAMTLRLKSIKEREFIKKRTTL